jgi:hypothetical protein
MFVNGTLNSELPLKFPHSIKILIPFKKESTSHVFMEGISKCAPYIN